MNRTSSLNSTGRGHRVEFSRAFRARGRGWYADAQNPGAGASEFSAHRERIGTNYINSNDCVMWGYRHRGFKEARMDFRSSESWTSQFEKAEAEFARAKLNMTLLQYTVWP